MKYGHKKQIGLSFNEAIEKVKSELTKEGFGVLTEIDVKATMKKKLAVDYENYIILGACNPEFANKALQADKEIGLLLPCNVVVYEDSGKTFVSAILPSVAMSMVDTQNICDIAIEVENKLKRKTRRAGAKTTRAKAVKGEDTKTDKKPAARGRRKTAKKTADVEGDSPPAQAAEANGDGIKVGSGAPKKSAAKSDGAESAETPVPAAPQTSSAGPEDAGTKESGDDAAPPKRGWWQQRV